MTDTVARPRFAVVLATLRIDCGVAGGSDAELVGHAVRRTRRPTSRSRAPRGGRWRMAGRRDAEALAKARPAERSSGSGGARAAWPSPAARYDEALQDPRGRRRPRIRAAMPRSSSGCCNSGSAISDQGNAAADRRLQLRRRRASDGESLLRAGRAAQALKRAQDANALYRAAAAAGADPAVDTAWGTLFLETYNPPERCARSSDALQADARVGAGSRRRGPHAGRRESRRPPPKPRTRRSRSIRSSPTRT